MDGMGRGNLVRGRIWLRQTGGCEGVEIWRWDGIKVGDFAVDSRANADGARGTGV